MRPDQITTSRSDTSLDREIEAMLSVEPSPDFVSRVRTRIADMAPPSWTMGLNVGWTSLAAGSVVVAVVVAVVVSRPHEVVQPEALARIARTSMQVDSPSDDLPAPPRVNSAKSPERHEPRVSKAAYREPQLLINPEEAAAIRRFLGNPQPARTELSLVTIEPQPLPMEAEALRRFLASPQPERVELSLMTIEPKPLPEFTFTPLPVFDPKVVLQGDYK